MTALSPLPVWQEFDDNGVPLAGALLYAYESGTTNLKDTYTDQSGTVANPNPVVFDSAGRASIWLGTGLYTLELQTSTGTVVWSKDGVKGVEVLPSVSSIADLRLTWESELVFVTGYATAGDGGDGWFYWDRVSELADNGGTIIQITGSSGPGRWIRIINDGRVNPKWFGATDTANCTNPFISANTYAASMGYIISCSKGIYRLDDDPVLTVKVELKPNAIIGTSSVNVPIDPIIDIEDNTRHFIEYGAGHVVLPAIEVNAAWFYNSYSGRAVFDACNCVAASGGMVRLNGGACVFSTISNLQNVPLNILPGSYLDLTSAVPTNINIYGNPEHKIIECASNNVPTLTKKAINPVWFGAVGNGSTDDTVPNLKAIAAGLDITFSGKTFVTGQLTLRSNQTINIINNATLQQRTADGTVSGTQSVFYLGDISNTLITGDKSGKIIGYRANNSEFRMGIRMDNCTNCHAEKVNISNFDGDGIYFGTNVNSVSNYNKDCSFKSIVVNGCRRQGGSVISAIDCLVSDCHFINIGVSNGTDPSSGYDIEPDSDYSQIKNFVIENCTSWGCAGPGFISHMRQINGSQEPNKKVSFTINNCRAYNCGKQALRITSVVSPNTTIKVRGFRGENCGQNGIQIGNFNVRSQLDIDDVELLNNCTETTDANWDFPAYFGTTAFDEAKSDILIFSSTSSVWDSYYSGDGVITGNIKINNVKIVQDTRDEPVFYSGNYVGSSGTARAPIKNVLLTNIHIDSVNTTLFSVDADYAVDVRYEDVYKFNTTTKRYEKFSKTYTANTSLSNDNDQSVSINNTGATGLVTYTLPGCEASDDKKQRFIIEVTDSDGIRLLCSGDDKINIYDQSVPVLTSYTIGAKIKLEKINVSAWSTTIIEGNWLMNHVSLLDDTNVSLLIGDWGKTFSNENYSADRVITLPTGDANMVGYHVTFLNRSSTYRMAIDPANSQTIMQLVASPSAAGKQIKSSAQGDSITLLYVGSDTWIVTSINGGWYDTERGNYKRETGFRKFIDGVYIGDQMFFTPEGGIAHKYINSTGAESVKGTVVHITGNNTVDGIVIDVPDPIGVVYESGVANNGEMWVVTEGKAEALVIGTCTAGQLARGFITGDLGYVKGSLICEAVPTAPFATDKHFYEFGHVNTGRTGAGLAMIQIHKN